MLSQTQPYAQFFLDGANVRIILHLIELHIQQNIIYICFFVVENNIKSIVELWIISVISSIQLQHWGYFLSFTNYNNFLLIPILNYFFRYRFHFFPLDFTLCRSFYIDFFTGFLLMFSNYNLLFANSIG